MLAIFRIGSEVSPGILFHLEEDLTGLGLMYPGPKSLRGTPTTETTYETTPSFVPTAAPKTVFCGIY